MRCPVCDSTNIFYWSGTDGHSEQQSVLDCYECGISYENGELVTKGDETIMDWINCDLEIKKKPEEGEKVLYAVLYITQLQKLKIPMEEVKFFMREKEGGKRK